MLVTVFILYANQTISILEMMSLQDIYIFLILLFGKEQRTDWINNLSDMTARNETEWHVKLSMLHSLCHSPFVASCLCSQCDVHRHMSAER